MDEIVSALAAHYHLFIDYRYAVFLSLSAGAIAAVWLLRRAESSAGRFGGVIAGLAVCGAGGATYFVTTNAHALVIPDGYERREVIFRSSVGLMAGELLTPSTAGLHPAVTLAVGSDASSYRTNYSRLVNEVITPVFSRLGFAILYFDKRGIGRSEGKWTTTSIAERAQDTRAALGFLKSLPVIDSSRVVVVGHSQGGWVVQLLAADAGGTPVSAISLAGPTVGVLEQMTDDEAGSLFCRGMPRTTARDSAQRTVANLETLSRSARGGRLVQLSRISAFRPDSALLHVRAPTLLLFGENDRLVPAASNLARLGQIFAGAVPEKIQAKVVAGVGHSLRRMDVCHTGSQSNMEYPSDLFDAITRFVISTTQPVNARRTSPDSVQRGAQR